LGHIETGSIVRPTLLRRLERSIRVLLMKYGLAMSGPTVKPLVAEDVDMAEPFTHEDTGKAVVTAEGNRVGTIGEVEDGRATVDSGEDDRENLTDHVQEMLGWGDSGGDQELKAADIDRNDDEIVLPPPI
jgi:hypothetical protein